MVDIFTVKENNMGQMKALAMDIEDMLNNGHSVNYTAAYLGAPVDLVTDMYEDLNGPDGGGPDYDGQPDEAQEWHDFDPDC